MIYHDMDPKGLSRIRSIKNAHFFLEILNEQKKVKRTEMLKSSGETPRAKKSVLLMLQVYFDVCVHVIIDMYRRKIAGHMLPEYDGVIHQCIA